MPPIRSWRSPGIEVRDGAVAGLGVFAVEPIPAGRIVAVKAGHIVDREEVFRLTVEIDAPESNAVIRRSGQEGHVDLAAAVQANAAINGLARQCLLVEHAGF